MSRSRRALVAAAASVGFALATAAFAQQQPAVLSPEAPPDGASVGKKPRFLVRADGGNIDALRFRIELSADGFKTIARTFDQLEEPDGWAYTVLDDQTPGAVYFTRQPIPGGDYTWRVASWDGLSWKPSADVRRLRIDDVPPADVEGVQMSRDPRTGCVTITWWAVTADRDGGAERVALYHVYRYASKGPTSPVRPYEAGTATLLEFQDCDAEALKKPLLFYRVVAEDDAGNVAGRRF